MIAVATNHVRQIALMPLRKVEVIVEFRLLLPPHVERLVHHDEPHAIGKVEKLRRGRIVRRPDGIHAHSAHDLELALERAVIDRRA